MVSTKRSLTRDCGYSDATMVPDVLIASVDMDKADRDDSIVCVLYLWIGFLRCEDRPCS